MPFHTLAATFKFRRDNHCIADTFNYPVKPPPCREDFEQVRVISIIAHNRDDLF